MKYEPQAVLLASITDTVSLDCAAHLGARLREAALRMPGAGICMCPMTKKLLQD